MRATLFTLLVVGWTGYALAEGVQEAPQGPGPVPYTALAPNEAPGTFQFAIVTDRTGGLRPGVFEDAVRKLNLLQPEFVMSIGDLVEGNTASESDLDAQWDEFEAMVGELAMPFFYVPGNHDVSNTEWSKAVWKRRHGPLYYHFVYRDVLFLCLNSDDDKLAHFSDEQIEYVKKVLVEHPGARWTFLFFHKPVWTNTEASGWDRIEAALKGRPYTVFTGHTHEYLKYDRGGQDYFVLGTTGGGTAHGGPAAGEFDHVVWVTMQEGAPQFANLMLDGIAGKDIRTDTSAKLVAPILDGTAVQSSPLLLEGPKYMEGTVQITVTNGADIPLEAAGTLDPTIQLRANPARIACVVQPHSTAAFDVTLSATPPVNMDTLQPLVTNWLLTYQLSGREPLVTPVRHTLVPGTVHSCPSALKTISVDGTLDEWGSLPLLCVQPAQLAPGGDSWTGAGDCSFQFAVTHDDAYAYVAIEVTDDRIRSSAKTRPWKQDGVELRLDARPDPARSANRGQSDKDQSNHLYVALSPGASGAETIRFDEEKLPAGLQSACVLSPSGYTAEVAVPVAYLDRMQGEAWSAFRLNVAVDDYDTPADTGATLWWRPNWASAASFAGSGTFRRE